MGWSGGSVPDRPGHHRIGTGKPAQRNRSDARNHRGSGLFPFLVSASYFGKQPIYLQIEPDQRDHDAEGAIPLHVFGSAELDAFLDEVEIEDQIEGGDGHDEQAESDADEPGAVDGDETDAEEAQQHLHHVKEEDAAGGSDDAQAKLLRYLDQSGAIGQQQNEESAEGEAHRLDDNARIAEVEDSREAAERQAFEQRVDGRRDRRPLLLEDGDHGADESAEQSDKQPRRHIREIARLKEEMPRPGRGGHGADEQNAGLVDGAVQIGRASWRE